MVVWYGILLRRQSHARSAEGEDVPMVVWYGTYGTPSSAIARSIVRRGSMYLWLYGMVSSFVGNRTPEARRGRMYLW